MAGRPLFTPSSAEERNWNTNSTYFHIADSGGNYIGFQFNPTTVTATRIPGFIPVTALNDFDGTNVNLCYGISGSKIISYNFSTATVTTIIDVQTLTSINLNNRIAIDMHVSHINGPVASVICGGTQQDTDFLAITYNIGTGAHHVLNLQNPNNVTLDGVKITPTGTIPTLLHNASIAPGGNYVCLDGVGRPGIAIWNINAGLGLSGHRFTLAAIKSLATGPTRTPALSTRAPIWRKRMRPG